MKGIIIAAIVSLGMASSVTAQQYRQQYTYIATDRGMKDKDPQAIATNKTVILDQRAGGLTRKQEKKVYRLYKKEARQEVKLRDLKQENRVAIKDILTREQYGKVRKNDRSNRDIRHYNRTSHNGTATQYTRKKAKKNRQHATISGCERTCCHK